MQKNSMTCAILACVAELGETTLNGFFPSKYPHAAIWRPLLGLERGEKIKRRTISTILWRLQQQGLVERTGAKKTAKWRVTPHGMEKLNQKEAQSRSKPVSDGIMRLVIFDIPENERRKRDVIRAELIGYGFEQLQKSVWIGRCPIPEDFIILMDTLMLNGKVHIFSVRDQGTIGEIK